MSAERNTGNKTHQGNGINYFCDLCPNGYACDGIGLSAPTSITAAGYWATAGAPTAMAVCDGIPQLNLTGVSLLAAQAFNSSCEDLYGICPVGHYCPPQSTIPTACEPGTYQDFEGEGSCKVSHKSSLLKNNCKCAMKYIQKI